MKQFTYAYRDPTGTVHKARLDDTIACTGLRAPVVSATCDVLTLQSACRDCDWSDRDVVNARVHQAVQEVTR